MGKKPVRGLVWPHSMQVRSSAMTSHSGGRVRRHESLDRRARAVSIFAAGRAPTGLATEAVCALPAFFSLARRTRQTLQRPYTLLVPRSGDKASTRFTP